MSRNRRSTRKADYELIRQLRRQGKKYREICDELGCSMGQIQSAMRTQDEDDHLPGGMRDETNQGTDQEMV